MTRRLPVVAALALAAFALVPPAASEAASFCNLEPAEALTASEAAVSRPALRSPSEYALSNVYARTELATRPDFVYAEAGPQYAGAFEALLPVGAPPPPRAVSAFPSEDIPDSDREDWGGHSETKVTSNSAFADLNRVDRSRRSGATAEAARSFTSTVVECNVITVIAGWSATNVTFPSGPSFERLGQQVTLVVGPSGSSAKVDTATVPAGRPFAPFTDPMEQGGGPKLEVGDPTTAAAAGSATASGGGFYFLQTDPATGQGAGYRIGAVEASVRVIAPGSARAAAATQATSRSRATYAHPSGGRDERRRPRPRGGRARPGPYGARVRHGHGHARGHVAQPCRAQCHRHLVRARQHERRHGRHRPAPVSHAGLDRPGRRDRQEPLRRHLPAMVRRRLAGLGVGLLLGACGSPQLKPADALGDVRASMANAGISAHSVRLDDPTTPGTLRAIARVDGGQITVTIDRDSGAFRRIEVTGDAATDRQIRSLAKQRADTGGARLRRRELGATLAIFVAAAAIGIGLARRSPVCAKKAPPRPPSLGERWSAA